jgi:hypothetical protein
MKQVLLVKQGTPPATIVGDADLRLRAESPAASEDPRTASSKL